MMSDGGKGFGRIVVIDSLFSGNLSLWFSYSAVVGCYGYR